MASLQLVNKFSVVSGTSHRRLSMDDGGWVDERQGKQRGERQILAQMSVMIAQARWRRFVLRLERGRTRTKRTFGKLGCGRLSAKADVFSSSIALRAQMKA